MLKLPRAFASWTFRRRMCSASAPAGTPRDIVTRLNAEITRILNTQDMKDMLAKQGTEVRAGPPEALGSFIAGEKAR